MDVLTRNRGTLGAAVGGLIGLPALFARGLIRLYRYSLSSLVGRTCRHLPTCSEFAEEAIASHGLWRGGWMALARFWRCRPFGSSGFDPVPRNLPAGAAWYLPWRYGIWRGGDMDGGNMDGSEVNR
jgi:putative membrane protein insertion efficiency factor